MTDRDRLRGFIRDVPDFPKPGIQYKDITPLLQNHAALSLACELLSEPFRNRQITHVVGVESRGFIFGPPVALALGVGFSIARKPGKLPWKTESQTYELEYGTDSIEMHADAVERGANVLLIDDDIATGGTAGATASLVERMGAHVTGCAFLIELGFLDGRSRLPDVPIESVLLF